MSQEEVTTTTDNTLVNGLNGHFNGDVKNHDHTVSSIQEPSEGHNNTQKDDTTRTTKTDKEDSDGTTDTQKENIASTINTQKDDTASTTSTQEERKIGQKIVEPNAKPARPPLGGDWIDVLGNGLLMKKVVRQGEGVSTRPSPQSEVTIKVHGYLNNKLVDKFSALTIYLGDNDFIPAVDIVASLMEKGEICQVKTDSKYAYGTTGRLPEIPPDTSLLYELELIKVGPPLDLLTIPEKDLITILDMKRGRGNDLFHRKEYTQAVVSYGKAVQLLRGYRQMRNYSVSEIDNLWIRCLNNLAAAQLKVDQFDEALESVREVLRHEPDNVKALYRCGKVLLVKEEFDESIRCLQRACELKPEEKAIHSELLKALRKQSQSKKTEKELYKRMISPPSSSVRQQSSSSSAKPSPNTSQPTSSSGLGWKGLMFGAGIAAVLAVGAFVLYSKYRK